MDNDNLIYLMRNDDVCAWYNGGEYITIDDMTGNYRNLQQG